MAKKSTRPAPSPVLQGRGRRPSRAAQPTHSRTSQPAPVESNRPNLINALILYGIVGLAVYLFLTAGLGASGGALVMPLDDTYIHFQYARAMAEGHSFRYNPDDPPTSGATSLLYPPVLAVGYLVGFRAEALAWWALAIGVLSWLGATWFVYQIAASNGGPCARWIGLAVGGAFALHGSLAWAFMSGMETGPMIFLTLLTFWNTVRGDLRGAVIAGALAALMRPEGVVIGTGAALYLMTKAPSRRAIRANFALYLLPFAAALAQPALNLVLTGTIAASGMQAKSYLYNVPPDFWAMVRDVLDNAGRMWQEFIIGGDYRTLVLTLAALLTIGFGALNAIRLRRLNAAVLALGWLLGLTLLISLLETAFWQFKRYQQPMLAIMFPLAAWPAAALTRQSRARQGGSLGTLAALGGMALLIWDSLVALNTFRVFYADNVGEVAASQIPMARYVKAALPLDAVVGVHDIGAMRYLGERKTYDVIGLTTPGAALPFRHGPGAMFEAMYRSPDRPAYFAIYPDARGLTYFAETSLFKEKLASFPSTAPARNVASATNSGQDVYRANWAFAGVAAGPQQESTVTAIGNLERVDTVNVADLSSESTHSYRWWQGKTLPGFPSEVRELDYVACGSQTCRVLDGGRLITGGEEMIVSLRPGQDAIWVTRVHPRNQARLIVSLNGERLGERIVPEIPGQWVEIATYIPGEKITQPQVTVRAEMVEGEGHYIPYYHWFYQGAFIPATRTDLPGSVATFGQSIQLIGRRVTYNPDSRTIDVTLAWTLTSPTPVDAKVFVHVYAPDGTLIEADGAQIDQRPGGGALPPANWLPGVVSDTYTLKVPEGLPAGTYRVAVGLYDPTSMERFTVEGEGAGSDNRLFIQEIGVNSR